MIEQDGKFMPNFKFRYLFEDVPYGMAVIKGIASLAGVQTPKLDMVSYWNTQPDYTKRIYRQRLGVFLDQYMSVLIKWCCVGIIFWSTKLAFSKAMLG